MHESQMTHRRDFLDSVDPREAIDFDVIDPLPDCSLRDPVALSRAETIFWDQILREHASFLAFLSPGDQLKERRRQALGFESAFANHLNSTRHTCFDRENYVEFNGSTRKLVSSFRDWQLKMLEDQSTGRIHSLAWPSYIEHLVSEAEEFAERLSRLSAGRVELERAHIVQLWAHLLGEHAGLVARLLDPSEREWARRTNELTYRLYQAGQSEDYAALDRAVREMIDFSEAAERGVRAGTIKSVIQPALAMHLYRESMKAADDLQRSG